MPVWDALVAAWSPVSVSLETWDRNCEPGGTAALPLYFFNDTDESRILNVKVSIASRSDPAQYAAGREQRETYIPAEGKSLQLSEQVSAHQMRRRVISLSLPNRMGDWEFQAVLENPTATVKLPVISSWRFRTFQPQLPLTLERTTVAVSIEEVELRKLLRHFHIPVVDLGSQAASVAIGSSVTWQHLQRDQHYRSILESAEKTGQSIVLLDVGPRNFGAGYRRSGSDKNPLQGMPTVQAPQKIRVPLFRESMQISFKFQNLKVHFILYRRITPSGPVFPPNRLGCGMACGEA
jgi:hypothetical protein